jgi:hypothetical protein
MRAADLLERMRASPRADWTITDIERLCRGCGLAITSPRRGSHYLALQGARSEERNNSDDSGAPTHQGVYIRALVALADRFRESKDGQ